MNIYLVDLTGMLVRVLKATDPQPPGVKSIKHSPSNGEAVIDRDEFLFTVSLYPPSPPPPHKHRVNNTYGLMRRGAGKGGGDANIP